MVTETPVKVTEMQQSKVKENKINSSSLLSDKDYSDLCQKLGKDTTDYYIERVKAFKEKRPQATFSMKSTILKWQREDIKSNKDAPHRIATDNSADKLNAAFERLNKEL